MFSRTVGTLRRALRPAYLGIVLVLVAACSPSLSQVIPTERPTVTPTFTPTVTPTRDANARPTATPTGPPVTATGGPSPTALLGATSTPGFDDATPTQVRNPNAPRIEFFTSDSVAITPGGSLTLFWSTRGANEAAIYRLDSSGAREQVWNVAPDGSLTVPTSRADRGAVNFVLSVDNGPFTSEEALTIPLSCLDPWFFQPAPESCADGPAETVRVIEEPFERGRMLYIANLDRVFALFNDATNPAWVSFANRYDPAIHAELEENFVPPPGLEQPLRILGFVWRNNDLVRNRLGLGTLPEVTFEGFVQTATGADGTQNLYVSSADGTVLQLLPEGAAWQIISLP